MRIYLLQKFVLKGLSEATKETPISISTPLMEFVRQKRADKGGNKGSAVVKGGKRAGSASPTNSGSSKTKRGSAKKKETEGMLQQLSLASNVGSYASTAAQRHEATDRLIKKYSSLNNCLGPEEISKPGHLELTNLEVEYLCIWVCRNTYGFRSPKVVKITHQDKSGKLISISTS
ncbi:hypothetical protein Peur_028218 [Populus x canadensis]